MQLLHNVSSASCIALLVEFDVVSVGLWHKIDLNPVSTLMYYALDV